MCGGYRLGRWSIVFIDLELELELRLQADGQLKLHKFPRQALESIWISNLMAAQTIGMDRSIAEWMDGLQLLL